MTNTLIAHSLAECDKQLVEILRLAESMGRGLVSVIGRRRPYLGLVSDLSIKRNPRLLPATYYPSRT